MQQTENKTTTTTHQRRQTATHTFRWKYMNLNSAKQDKRLRRGTEPSRGLKKKKKTNWIASCKCVSIWLVAWKATWRTLQPPCTYASKNKAGTKVFGRGVCRQSGRTRRGRLDGGADTDRYVLLEQILCIAPRPERGASLSFGFEETMNSAS